MKHAILLTVLVAVVPTVFATDKVPLKLELPRPLFVGTPVPIALKNLEKPHPGGRRPDFLVPPGVVNLAAGKPVTSSDPEPLLGDLEQITDGHKSGDEGNVVELGPGPQWVQIDLGASQTLHAIVFWHFHAQVRAYRGVVVQVSDDPDFAQGVTTLYNNDYENAVGLGVGASFAYIETYEGRLVDARGVKARYVRLYSAGNTSSPLNHYIEVEVHGLP
jgi:hypothetical protein